MFFIVSCVVLMMVDENADENASLHFLLENDPFFGEMGFLAKGWSFATTIETRGC